MTSMAAPVRTVPDSVAVESLADVDVSLAPGEVLCLLADEEVERRQRAARLCKLLGEAETSGAWRGAHFRSMTQWARARLGWSDADCRRHLAIARAGQRHPDLLDSLADGDIPVEHAAVLARHLLHHPRLAERPQFEVELAFWLGQARRREYDDFRTRIAEWVATCEPDDADDQHQQHADRRTASVRADDDGTFHLSALFDPVSGAEFNECFARFREALLHSDWSDAEAVHGADTHPGHLHRTDPQRAADALVLMARLAARNTTTSVAGASSDPGVIILVDHTTFLDELARLNRNDTPDQPDPTHSDLDTAAPLPHQRRCRIANGPAVAPSVAVDAAIAGWVRFVMVDTLGNPVAVSSKQRLFRGPLRDTVLALHDRCLYPGCRRRAGACDADHRVEHAQGGPTALTNLTPGPVCGTHNRFKALTGYLPAQDHDGIWHTCDLTSGRFVDPLA